MGRGGGRQFHIVADLTVRDHSASLGGGAAAGVRLLPALHQGFGARLADRRGRADLCRTRAEQQGFCPGTELRYHPAAVFRAVLSADAAWPAAGGKACPLSTSLTSRPRITATPCCAA